MVYHLDFFPSHYQKSMSAIIFSLQSYVTRYEKIDHIAKKKSIFYLKSKETTP